MKLLNWILCKAGLCYGHIEHIKDADGVWWLGMRCQNTGTFHSPIKSKFQDAVRPSTPADSGKKGNL